MASIPLLSDQDPEMGELPSYEDAVQGKTSTANSKTTASGQDTRRGSSDTGNKKIVGLFSRHFDEVSDANSVAFAHISIRLGFLRKVLGILAFQFLVTVVFCTGLYMTPAVKGYVQQQPWIPMGSMFGSLGLLFAMFIHSHTVPLNYFLLVGWTILQAITVGSIVTFYDMEVVIQAVLLTSVVVVGLFVYTLQTKRDFQKHYAIIYTLSIIFLMATVIQIILMSSTFNFLMSMTGAALFSVYLVFDIDMIMHHYSEEDYIIACISIYMDIIGLFLRILEILNEINKN
jgi:FtsH-binding integral membrane protein